ncbi:MULTISPECIES: hypothetical protein [unclassified Solwaraspora]|uniref:hypothetical protein n=1 Tax=unclassified Solwaraspora TaxID=2627926 RepID=UPI00259BB48F|nr:hypothetical protein [Solwaraspora sp. WMMA2056]WJK42458.1 hypothetical protein O7608_08815 [Solwaraspora sp. WMMA2056]
MLDLVQVVAANNFGDTRSGGLAGPMGLFLLLLLAAVTVLLVRNMNARLRRLPERFESRSSDDTPATAEANVLDLTDRQSRPGSPL